MIKALLGLSLLFALAPAMAAEPCPAEIKIAYYDFGVPPMIHGSGLKLEDPPGLIVEWVRAAIARSSCTPRLLEYRRPNKRTVFELANGEMDLAGSMADAPDRRKAAVFPMRGEDIDLRLSFFSDDLSLWTLRTERGISWDGKHLVGPAGFRIGIPPGTINEGLARTFSWPADVGKNGPKVVEQLLGGRFPVILINDVTAASFPPQQRERIKKLPPAVHRTMFFSPASTQFYAHYPGFVQRYWSNLCQIARANPAQLGQDGLPACR